MAENQLVTFFNRYTQKMETEAIYGESYLKFIYGNPLGKLALWAAVKRSFFSKWYGSRMSAQSSSKKISPFISDYKFLSNTKNKGSLIVNLKYNNGSPVIKEIRRVSKPGRRIYTRADSIPKVQSGLGVAIVSTSKGIMSGNDAKSKNIGGEIICKVF